MVSKIAERLVQLRGRMKQSEVAKIAGVSAATISHWENDVHSPTAEAVAKLAVFWNVSADYLVGISDHPTPWPADSWVIDLDFVDALRKQDGSIDLLDEQGAFAIPRRMRIVSSTEYLALERELKRLLRQTRTRRKTQP